MTCESAEILERLLRTNDLDWLLDMYDPAEQAIPRLLDQLDQLTAEFKQRIGYEVSFEPQTLEQEARRNPHKVRAFLQAFGATGNLQMLTMVWRVLQGLSIRAVDLRYRELDSFQLSIVLARPESDSTTTETYVSQDIQDAKLLRHFGIATVNNRPLFDGYACHPKS